MSTVHVRIGKDNDFIVPQLFDIEIIADSASEGSDHSFYFVIGNLHTLFHTFPVAFLKILEYVPFPYVY